MEIVLLSLLAVQSARLVWTVATPVDPVGDWRTSDALRPPMAGSLALLGEFDPFFRLTANTGALVVTSLDIKLYGVREDRASGRGSAIIGTPDGQQRSYAVGDEIVPGVTLTAVGFDNVTVSRGGTQEQLFLDQSTPAETAGATAPGAAAPTAPPAATPPESSGMDRSSPETPETMEQQLPPEVQQQAPARPPAKAGNPSGAPQAPATGATTNEIQSRPRLYGGQVSAIPVRPQGSGAVVRAAGFVPDDVISTIPGRRMASAYPARHDARRPVGQKEADSDVTRAGSLQPPRPGAA
jgi:general secretion pathway protein C